MATVDLNKENIYVQPNQAPYTRDDLKGTTKQQGTAFNTTDSKLNKPVQVNKPVEEERRDISHTGEIDRGARDVKHGSSVPSDEKTTTDASHREHEKHANINRRGTKPTNIAKNIADAAVSSLPSKSSVTRTVKALNRSTVLKDGLIAGAVATVVSIIPSTLYLFFTSRHRREFTERLLFEAFAVSNLVLRSTAPSWLLITFCILVHLSISFGVSLLLSYLCRDRRPTFEAHLSTCLPVAFLAHVFNLVILPKILGAPLINHLLKTTGHLPYLADHLVHGLVTASILVLMKTMRGKSAHD